MAYTIKELDDAIIEVLEWSGFEIKNSNRIMVHRDASTKAFIERIDGKATDVLREAYKDLENTGSYQPSDGFFPDEP
jgi:hypothetical protein